MYREQVLSDSYYAVPDSWLQTGVGDIVNKMSSVASVTDVLEARVSSVKGIVKAK